MFKFAKLLSPVSKATTSIYVNTFLQASYRIQSHLRERNDTWGHSVPRLRLLKLWSQGEKTKQKATWTFGCDWGRHQFLDCKSRVVSLLGKPRRDIFLLSPMEGYPEVAFSCLLLVEWTEILKQRSSPDSGIAVTAEGTAPWAAAGTEGTSAWQPEKGQVSHRRTKLQKHQDSQRLLLVTQDRL